jgi:Tol biopolymer transport system component
MRSISLLAVSALLIGVTGSPGCGVEHGNVAFDVAPYGKRVVFSAADGDLYLFHLDSRQVNRLTSTDENESQPAFSPSGLSVVFSTTKDDMSHLGVLTLEDKKVRVLTNQKDASDISPAFSPDGKQITFARAHRLRNYSFGGTIWDDYDIYVMNVDSSEPRRLTQMKYYGAGSPHFTPDGKSVIYLGVTTDDATPSFRLWEADVGGSKPPHLVGHDPNVEGPGDRDIDRITRGAWVGDPRISPVGQSIVFTAGGGIGGGTPYDLYITKLDGADARPLGVSKVSKHHKNAVFLPDGKGILFLAGTEENNGGRAIYSLWRVDVDGKNARRVADSGLFTDPQRWKPTP